MFLLQLFCTSLYTLRRCKGGSCHRLHCSWSTGTPLRTCRWGFLQSLPWVAEGGMFLLHLDPLRGPILDVFYWGDGTCMGSRSVVLCILDHVQIQLFSSSKHSLQ
ncbi:ORF1215 [White spot syndrome virus]|uniref:ORF1215 n=1 Tax=White spot syndrome virus TaxID=342409 RepID=A0A2D3I5H1_9VIRU|nr:ORF1215 [White spot syndrome virus]